MKLIELLTAIGVSDDSYRSYSKENERKSKLIACQLLTRGK